MKFFSIIVATFSFNLILNAQLEIGVKTGIGKCQFLKIDAPNGGIHLANRYDPSTYFQIGGVITYEILRNLYVKTEVFYSKISTYDRFDSVNIDLPGKDKYTYHTYLSIPFLLQYKLFWNIRVEAGAGMGFLLKNVDNYYFTGHDFKKTDPYLLWGINFSPIKYVEIGYVDYKFLKYFATMVESIYNPIPEAYFKNDAWCFYVNLKVPIKFNSTDNQE